MRKQASAIVCCLIALLLGGCAQTPETATVEAELRDIAWWQQNAHAIQPPDNSGAGFLALPMPPAPLLAAPAPESAPQPESVPEPEITPAPEPAPAPITATDDTPPSTAPRSLTISLGKQTFVYHEAAQVVRTGSISSGTPGHATPTGQFRVLSKDRDKVSSRYTNQLGMQAWMPYAIQFYGHYFLHEGWLPGYPDSHGCVRVGEKDARFLFERLKIGDPVAVVP